MKQPNVPMNHAITTCRHKVDKEKFDSGWDRIWGEKKDEITWEDMVTAMDSLTKNKSPDPEYVGVFHPDAKFPEFNGLTISEALEAGLVPDGVKIILQTELPK